MDFFNAAKKKAATLGTEFSNAIYATGRAVRKAGAVWSTPKDQEEPYEDVTDFIIAAEDYDRSVRKNCRDALDKAYAEGKKIVGVCSKKEVDQLDTLLPVHSSTEFDVWKQAQPVTQITDPVYPFNTRKSRPTENELAYAYKVALGVLLNPVNKDYQKEMEPYVVQMFGMTKEGFEESVALDRRTWDFNLHVKLIRGRDMYAKDADGKSDPYCFITVVKSEHVKLISSKSATVEKINDTKRLGLNIKKSRVMPKTLNPRWNEEFELPLRQDRDSDMILIEVWDSDDIEVGVSEISLKKIGRFFYDRFTHTDDLIGREFMSLSDVNLLPKKKELTIWGCHKRKPHGYVTIEVQLVRRQHSVNEAKLLKDHSMLTRTVLDFESHKTEGYAVGWNAKITPLGDKLLSLNAKTNGITLLQQASIIFPFLQLYDKHIGLSIIGYFGLVKTIRQHKDQLHSQVLTSSSKSHADGDLSDWECGGAPPVFSSGVEAADWANTLMNCLKALDDSVIGTLRRQNELFNFKDEKEIEYLTLHVELLKEMYRITLHVQRLEESRRKTFTTVLQDECVKACKQWFDKLISLETDEQKQLLHFLEVVNDIIQHLRNIKKFGAEASTVFKQNGIDYYTLMFVTLDQQISDKIKEFTTNRNSKGGIPSYHLFLRLSELIQLADYIPLSDRPRLHLNKYHQWFKCFICDWIAAVANKSCNEMKRAVTSINEVATLTKNVKYSQSALSASACFRRISKFWNNLDWPVPSERYGLTIGIVEVCSEAIKFYVDESLSCLERKEYLRDTSSKEFLITKQLCISLNDIQYTLEKLSMIPISLQFEQIIAELTRIEGEEQAMLAHITLSNLMCSLQEDVQCRLDQVVYNVAQKFSDDITSHLQQIVKKDPKIDVEQVIDPMMVYLEKNLSMFNESLLPVVLEIMLQEIWNVTVLCLESVVKCPCQLKPESAKLLRETVKVLQDFFHAEKDGLSKEKIESEEYKKLCEVIDTQATPDDELFHSHLKHLAKLTKLGNDSNGLLSFSVGYIQSKQTLEVYVIKATNLPPLDSDGLSDPYVYIQLKPTTRFQIEAVQTEYKKKTLNPTYFKQFDIEVKEDLLDMTGSVLTLSVYDRDTVKDDFAGMVVVEGREIPRLPGGSSNIDDPKAPQRKTYELPLVPDTMTPKLEDLKKRNSKHYKSQQLKRKIYKS